MRMYIRAALLAATLSFACVTPAAAQNYPFVVGNYTEVSMIHIEDGAGLQYATFLKDSWRKNMEFAKSKGWVTSYAVYSNENKRPGEPDLYLSVTFPTFADAAEDERRADAYRDFMKMDDKAADDASGNRAKYRTVMGSFLLRELKFK